MLAFVWGCDQHTRYKVLTFFFTGVPSPEEIAKRKQEELQQQKKAELARQEQAAKAKQQQSASASDQALPSLQEAAKPKLYSHAPYAEGRCDQCHKTAVSVTIFRDKTEPSGFSRGGGRPGVLLAPRKELCAKCHEPLRPETAISKGLWLHTAAAEGDWNICHDPHQSKNRQLLLESPGVVCLLCHVGENMMKIAAHKQPGECLDCHNPHLGKDKKMLKQDYTEKQSPANPAAGKAG